MNPIAQTFGVLDGIGQDSTGNITPGAFLTKIDLFFESKSATQPIIVEIRECDGLSGFITSRVVPFSKIILESDDINVSSDGSSATPVIFETPVYLLNGVTYALTIQPADGNLDYNVWTARLGGIDKITGNRVTKQPAVGAFHVSTNGTHWDPILDEDLKFKMYFANFGTNQTGTVVLKNINKEYLTLDTVDSDQFPRVDETIHGETTLVLSGAVSANVGDFIVRGSANGVVTFNSGSTVRVKEVTTANKFTNGTKIYKYAKNSGANTGVNATISSQSTPTGKMYFYDSTTQANTTMHLSEPSGSFTSNTFIRGQINGTDARIVSVDNLNVDEFKTFIGRLDLQDTTTTATGKLAISSAALDSTYRRIDINNESALFDDRRFILSRSNENSTLSGAKSAEIRIVLTNTINKRHSPVIDTDRAALFTTENLVNNDSTNEDTTSNGNALTRYIQKTVVLEEGQDAEDLKVFLAAYKPASAEIEVYVKLLNNEDGETIEDKTWLQLTQVTSDTEVSDSENTEDFREYEYSIPSGSLTGDNGEVEYTDGGITYTGYKRFKIKIVLLSTIPTRVPRIRDFRAIALQI